MTIGAWRCGAGCAAGRVSNDLLAAKYKPPNPMNMPIIDATIQR
ncbi:hypothetical protein SAMN05428959_1011103 [Duganella sp. CF517]|nr:hypothetical protein SAMN05428959_1011103 [Duganella sp. CF517]